MSIDRRHLLLSTLTLSAMVVGCAAQPGAPQPVLVDLPTVKLWSAQVAATMQGISQGALPTLQGGPLRDLLEANTIVQSANADIQQAVQPADVKQAALTLISTTRKAAVELAPLYPPLAAYEPAIDLGLFVLTAFVNSLPIVPPAPPAAKAG